MKKMHRILLLTVGALFAAALLCVGYYFATTAGKEKQGSEMDWVLRDYYAFLEQLEEPGTQSCSLTFYADSPHTVYFTPPDLDDLISRTHCSKIYLDNVRYFKDNLDALRKLSGDALVPWECKLCSVEVVPRIYYVIQFRDDVVLEVLKGGFCDHASSLVRINGYWFEDNTAVYEAIWPFLPDPVREEWAVLLKP